MEKLNEVSNRIEDLEITRAGFYTDLLSGNLKKENLLLQAQEILFPVEIEINANKELKNIDSRKAALKEVLKNNNEYQEILIELKKLDSEKDETDLDLRRNLIKINSQKRKFQLLKLELMIKHNIQVV